MMSNVVPFPKKNTAIGIHLNVKTVYEDDNLALIKIQTKYTDSNKEIGEDSYLVVPYKDGLDIDGC